MPRKSNCSAMAWDPLAIPPCDGAPIPAVSMCAEDPGEHSIALRQNGFPAGKANCTRHHRLLELQGTSSIRHMPTMAQGSRIDGSRVCRAGKRRVLGNWRMVFCWVKTFAGLVERGCLAARNRQV